MSFYRPSSSRVAWFVYTLSCANILGLIILALLWNYFWATDSYENWKEITAWSGAVSYSRWGDSYWGYQYGRCNHNLFIYILSPLTGIELQSYEFIPYSITKVCFLQFLKDASVHEENWIFLAYDELKNPHVVAYIYIIIFNDIIRK